MTAVDGQEFVKQGEKGWFDLLMAFKTHHQIILKVSLYLFRSCLLNTLIL